MQHSITAHTHPMFRFWHWVLIGFLLFALMVAHMVVPANGTAQSVAAPSIPAFPGAEGFGAESQGGRGGEILFVDNLNDSGPGSLRAALEAGQPRTIIFRVGGTITLKNAIIVTNPYVTVAGQTAPGDGIALRIDGTADTQPLIIETHDVIIRHLRVRSGPGVPDSVNGDAITITGGYNIIIDHSSLSWGTDEVINTWYSPYNVTIQNSIVSEGLYDSVHKKGIHSMGGLFGDKSDRVTLYKNLFAHNSQRNPMLKSDGSGTFQVVNNVFYHWHYFGAQIGDGEATTRVNFIGNYYKPGPETRTNRYEVLVGTGAEVYVEGNIGPRRTENTQDEWSLVGDIYNFEQPAATKYRVTSPFDAPEIDVQPALEAYDDILEDVGATKPKRDAVDLRVIQDVINGTGKMIDYPDEVGGWPELASGTPYVDNDGDGMADDWETQYGFNPDDSSDTNQDADGDGYTNIEEFLNETNPGQGGSGTPKQGLAYEFFTNATLSGTPDYTGVDATIDFDWGSEVPAPGLSKDTFSVRWTGQVEPQYSERYTFCTRSDDGIRLWVNGQRLINNWTDHVVTENCGTVELAANQRYDLKVEYYEHHGRAVVQLFWLSASQRKEIIPKSQLYSDQS
ncbi:MAG: Pectate lyase [Chloroflexi bacterium AL-W]|nr:Pectate lyase [Chloroflexi bacterium AL-N1]NOK71355.1 Pectate lyase [Chloroflexi bacterium AL-N10]NOK78758.1 Pectate lyase [Chloroflexi bacterium AL-N5]NOK86128.1 Pectate lyase [Chloroflexi bacterium AL-W]NOK93081.1 Pectate lyase [Chloroflexi bacterium AL-N15]